MDIKNKIIDSSLLFMIGIIWGSQFIFIKLSLENYTVLQLAFLRTFYATVFLFIICFLMGKKFFYHRNLLDILKVIALSLLEIVIPFCMINWGQKFLSGSMAAIIIGTIPFFTIVLVSVTRLEKVSLVSLLGIIIGFLGLWVLFYPDILNQSLFDNILPKLAILSGALSFSIAILLIKTLPSENPLILSRDTFFLGSVILFFIEGSSIYQIRFDSVPPYSLFSSIILGVICSGLVYVIYVGYHLSRLCSV